MKERRSLERFKLKLPSKVEILAAPQGEEKALISGKPFLNVYHVHNGEPCPNCRKLAVTQELHDVTKNTRKRLCDPCAGAEKKWFLEHGCNIVYSGREEPLMEEGS